MKREFPQSRRVFQTAMMLLTFIVSYSAGFAQTPLPSPSPAPTPITKTGSILVNSPSTVGRITKWVGSSNNGTGTIGNSVITESSLGTIGIGTNPFSDVTLGVDGGNTLGGLFGRSNSSFGIYGLSNNGIGVYGFGGNAGVIGAGPFYGVSGTSDSGYGVYGVSIIGHAGFFQGNVNVTGILSAGNLFLNSDGGLKFADGTVQTTASKLTGVTAGTGLTGGGTVGNITLDIANGGVNSTQLANGSVTATKIAAGQVVKTFNGLSENVTLAAGDNITVTPAGNTLTVAGRTPLNPLQIATLHWYGGSTNASFDVTPRPIGLAFDGSNMWVAHYSGGTGNVISKVRSSDGAVIATFTGPPNSEPYGLAFDGAYLWIANSNASSVTKLRPSDGTIVGTYPAGAGPRRVAFDGANIWVANWDGDTVTKIRASDGTTVDTYLIGPQPHGVAFDGANIWVTSTAGTITKLNASDGSPMGTYPVGNGAIDVAFDGSNVWVASGNGTVTKLRASDGMCVNSACTFNAPNAIGLTFDGVNIWISDRYGNGLTKLRASDGLHLGTFATGSQPYAVAFDGAYVWVTNWASASLSKF